jgi:hypothetical protein
VAGPDAFARTDAAVLLGSVVAAAAGVIAAAVALGTSSRTRSDALRPAV